MKRFVVVFVLAISISVILMLGCAKSTSNVYYTVILSAGGAGSIQEMHATNAGDSLQRVQNWPYTSPTYNLTSGSNCYIRVDCLTGTCDMSKCTLSIYKDGSVWKTGTGIGTVTFTVSGTI